MKLQVFHFKIEYISGDDNTADGYSRSIITEKQVYANYKIK